MHTLLVMSSLGLALVFGVAVLLRLRRIRAWERRRMLQLFVLGAPVASLGVALVGVHHFAGQICYIGAPNWDQGFGLFVPLAMGASALFATAAGLARLAAIRHAIGRRAVPGGPELEAMVGRLAGRLGTPRPRLLVAASDRPVALAAGISRPTLVLSRWMLSQLDRRELDSVVAHELAHIARRDYLVAWMATVLRDAFWYLPTNWAAHRQLRRDMELAADDLAVAATARPLALASALAKVWEAGLGPQPASAVALASSSDLMETRIGRLLSEPISSAGPGRPSMVSVWTGAVALAGVTGAEATNLALLAASMGCGPLSLLSRLI